jgi:hypothetical protein
MSPPGLTGSEQELQCLAEWFGAMEILRNQLGSGSLAGEFPSTTQTRELAQNVLRAENRLRAHVGLPPLMH